MDVFLLSRLLRELIIDNERVPVPGLGYLTTEPTPANFSEDGLAILPPGRKISFRAEKMASGEMIWKYYSEESGVDEETAKAELEAFMTQLIPMLKTKRVIDLQGIGRFRCTSDGNVYFAAAEADNVFNSAFSFEPVTLRPLNKFDTLIDVSAAEPEDEPALIIEQEPELETEVESEAGQDIAVGPEEEHIPESVSGFIPESDPEPVIESAVEQIGQPVANKKTWKIFIWVAAAIVAAAIIGYLLLNSGWFDNLLYTEEELELIKNLR